MAATRPASRRRLVIVDDEPVILDLLASLFVDEPLDVVACRSGKEAVAKMEQGGVDLLLTDKNLPDFAGGGLDLVRMARQITPDAEAIVITGYASLDTALRAMELGVYDYIVKPPRDIFDVKRKVFQALEKQDLARVNRQLVLDLSAKNAELEKALDALKATQAELVQAEKLAGIGTLAAGIAHEISSPLFGVMGLAEAIRDEDDGKLVKQYASDIVEYSRTIKDIVVELSSYSRTADHEYLTTVDLARAIDDAVRLVQRTGLGGDGVSITVDVPAGLFVHARTNEIQQVFVNLVKNAVEAVQEKHGASPAAPGAKAGRVSVSGGQTPREGGATVWVRVSDDGSGIPVDKQAVIFDPFYTTKPPGKGTGLGLNIVYRILTKYRGTIQVESQPGQGAAFLLRFPVD